MKKNYYIAPDIRNVACEGEEMIATSILDPTSDNPSVTVSEEEYNGEFTTRRSFWDDED